MSRKARPELPLLVVGRSAFARILEKKNKIGSKKKQPRQKKLETTSAKNRRRLFDCDSITVLWAGSLGAPYTYPRRQSAPGTLARSTTQKGLTLWGLSRHAAREPEMTRMTLAV